MCRRKMAQEITVTKVEDHYEMQFGGGSTYPVPTNAIDKLGDDLTPEEVGESVTFRGDYGGHKHCKTFDVEEVIDDLDSEDEKTEAETDGEIEETSAGEDDGQRGDEEDEKPEEAMNIAEPTPEHVAEVGYLTAAGQAQQIEAQRLFVDNGDD